MSTAVLSRAFSFEAVRSPRFVLMLFGATLFSSAALLFCVEPMVARMLLPTLGGAPAVWITCMLFFQAALLAAYGYAHVSSRFLSERTQRIVHVGLLALPFLVLPIHFTSALSDAAQSGNAPAAWLLALLVVGAGLPFFVVSASAPLLQKWFASAGHPSAKDPYFLYGASNLGSMVGLAAYPALLEPTLGLTAQARLWTWGYTVLALLVAACGAVVLRTRASDPALASLAGHLEMEAPIASANATAIGKVTWMRRARWVGLAFVPSSLLLGVTTFVTTDIAPIPLFWVVPLGLYLLSFIFVFAKNPPIAHATMVRALPLAVSMTVISIALEAQSPGWLLVILHCATLFLASMVCHGELARDRPEAEHLTEYYLWISVGGVLGGAFNALLAPALFKRIVEYPLAIVLACLCMRADARPSDPGASRAKTLDYVLPALVGALAVGLLVMHRHLGLKPNDFLSRLIVATPFLIAHSFSKRPRRYALSVGAALVASTLFTGMSGSTIAAERNFYGVVRVTHDDSGRFVQLVHGNTVHGIQAVAPKDRETPLGYYHRTGPLGPIFRAFDAHAPADASVGVIGLGSGEMAAYARPGESWTFYEINPAVIKIALDPAYFTFVSDRFPGGKNLTVVEGDARLRLHEAKDHGFALLVLDAFSSDAIPAHLLTREAVALYLEKLGEHGILAAHISNRYLDLKPVFGNLAHDAGLVTRSWADLEIDLDAGKVPSHWIVLAKSEEDMGSIATDPRFEPLPRTDARVWSDDFSNLISVYRIF